MKSAPKKVILGLAGIASMAVAQAAQAVDYVPLTNFGTNPTSAGWTTAGTSASWSSGSLITGTSGGWYTPVFNPTPGEYYKVQYDAMLTSTATRPQGQFGAFFGNPAATYDLEPTSSPLYRKTSTGGNVVTGQLLADNYTAIKATTSAFTTITEYTRAPINATQSFVYFGNDSVGTRIDNVRVSSATHAEVAAWADGMYNNTTNFPSKLVYTPPANRYANIPNTLAKLESAQTLKVVMLGDSIQGDSQNSAMDVLIERNFPGSRVEMHSAVGHGTGMNDWLNASSFNDWQHNGLKLQEAVFDVDADLVIIGGISNGSAASMSATLAIVRALKAQGTEVMLNTGCFGNQLAANFIGAVDGTTTGADLSLPYRNWAFNLAKDEGIAFFDTYGAWGTYLKDLRTGGKTDEFYYRDFYTHANTIGKDMIGRLYEGYFTPVPEPTSLGFLILGGAGLIARRRKAN